jgi:hypothetical protein
MRFFFALTLPLLLSACPKQEEIWIVEGSRADSIVFGVGTSRGGAAPRHFGGLRVDRCSADGIGRHALWLLVAAGSERMVGSVVYGQPPEGYRSSAGPAELPPGCYMVSSMSGNGRTWFRIHDDGSVVEQNQPE